MKKTLLILTATMLALSIACGPGLEQNPGNADGTTDGGSSGSDGGTQNNNGGFEMPCNSSKPCPSGQFCFNGLCAIGCNTNAECASDQYCDTDWKQCRNKTVSTCPETPCAETQSCVQGYCTAKEVPATQCDPSGGPNDGCATDAFCLDPNDTGTPKCHTFPPCPQDGNCPVGAYGALCNDNLLQGKARVCLPNACKTAANCPANWHCVKFNQNDVIGSCSNGGPGSPCSAGTECLSGNCTKFGPAPGFCQ